MLQPLKKKISTEACSPLWFLQGAAEQYQKKYPDHNVTVVDETGALLCGVVSADAKHHLILVADDDKLYEGKPSHLDRPEQIIGYFEAIQPNGDRVYLPKEL